MSLDATVGGANANSYCTVAFADTYLLQQRVGAADWQTQGTEQKEAALIQATRILEKMRWAGTKTAPDTQALKYPRVGQLDDEGVLLDSDVIPVAIKQAAAELAYALTQDATLLTSTGLNRYKSLTIGDEKYDFRETSDSLPSAVQQLISNFIASSQAYVIRA